MNSVRRSAFGAIGAPLPIAGRALIWSVTVDLATKTDSEIETWIKNHEIKGATNVPLYRQLLEERVRRSQLEQLLDFDRSLGHLKQAAIDRVCTSYGALAAASAVDWSKARHQMNGPNGHLDRLLDICHIRGLPLLTAICVNQGNITDGELGKEALAGFIAGARRLGIAVGDGLAFHHQSRDECWAWGFDQRGAEADCVPERGPSEAS